jgi:hypothetical protein
MDSVAEMKPLKDESADNRLIDYRPIIERLFAEWERWPRIAKFRLVPVMDYANDRYILMIIGWDGYKRIYNVFLHVDIINGKLWIQQDSTEEGIANQFVAAGIPKDQIVLGFKSEERRKDTEFAVA